MNRTSTLFYYLILLIGISWNAQAESSSIFKSLTGPSNVIVCSGEYYDSGGPDGEYGNNENETFTICPEEPNEVVSIFFASFNTENAGTGCFDQITVYDGGSTAAPLIPSPSPDTDGWCWDRNDSPPTGSGDLQDMTLVSTNADGCLTFVFTSDGSVTRPGWEATYECISTEAAPAPSFIANPTVTCNGVTEFNNTTVILGPWTDVTYSWDFGDGNTSNQEAPTHTYETEGTYDVTLEVCNQYGCGTTTVEASVVFDSQDPVCFEFFMPAVGEETITSCMGTLYDSGGPDGNYNFGEAGSATILAAGLNTIELNITQLEVSEFGDNIIIYDGVDINAPVLGNYTGFTPPSDPIVSSSNAITIQFLANSFNSLPGFAIEFECVPVVDPPTPNPSANPPFSCGGNVQFFDFSGSVPTSWTWDFGDGNISDEQNPFHTYSSAGEYTVSFTVCNDLGCNDTTFAYQVLNEDSPACDPIFMPNATNAGTIVNVTECTGILQDSGGDGGPYSDEEFGTVVLGNEGAANVTVAFSEFVVGNFDTDILNIYDGPDNGAPLIGSYTGMFLPNGGNPIVSSGSYLTVEFISDFFGTAPGFTLYWTTSGSTNPPIANFEVSDLNPPFNTPVQFTDITTELPSSWFWNFGDGSNSFAQNPQYAYEEAGDFVVTMSAANCVEESNAPPQTITVQEPPLIIVNPDELYIELESGETLDTAISISNFGAGDLVYNINGPQTSYTGTIDIVVYNFGNDIDQNHIENTLEIIEEGLSGINFHETNTSSVEELENLLNNKEIFLLPGQRGVPNPEIMGEFAPVLQAFVEDGGTVIFTATNETETIFNTELLDGSFGTDFQNPELEFTDDSHPITTGVSQPFDGKSACVGFNITNDDKTVLIEENGFDVLSYREQGDGKVMFYGFNYLFSNESMKNLLIQGVLYGTGSSDAQWLFVDPLSDIISPGITNDVTVTFDATGAPAGTYIVDMEINSNSPDFPLVVVPCTLVVTGTPAIAADPLSLDFGNVVQFTEESLIFTIFNTGSDTLFITDIIPDYDAFSVDMTDFWIYPGESEDITITYSPQIIETLTDIPLTIVSNAGEILILLNANGTGAPVASGTPNPIEITLNVGETGSVPFQINNTGQGFLEFCTQTTIVGVNTGFNFNFDLDAFPFEFYWQLLDSEGNIVQEVMPGEYTEANTNYDVQVGGLNPNETYTLNLLDTFGDGALDNYIITDLATGAELASGVFPTGDFMEVEIGSVTQNPLDLWLVMDGEECDTLPFPDGLNEYLLNFSAEGLLGGVYETTILIISNDPVNPIVEIPVVMTVVGIPEVVLVEPTDATLDFGSLLIGLNNSLTFTITNPGTDNLIVSEFLLGDAQYTVNATDANIAPGDSITVTVTFTPTEIGVFDNTLTIVTNAGEVVIDLLGEGQGAPLASIDPGSIEVTLLSGDSEEVDLTLFNNGEGNMEYTISLAGGGAGFLFEFTLDFFPGEFYWQLVDSNGNIVQEVTPGTYTESIAYVEELVGLSEGENYTLNLLDTFGDGALDDYTVSDLISGAVVATGAFPTGDFMAVPLGSPVPAATITITPTGGDVDFPGEQPITILIDAEGLLAGIYEYVIIIETNDPQNPIIEVPVTLNVIAFPQAGFSADNEELVCGAEPIQFTDMSVNVPTEWLWDFGDGNTSTEQNPIHSYTASGMFDVTLIASNDVGSDTLTLMSLINVDQACTPVTIPDGVGENITVNACNGKFFDSGGEAGTYKKDNDATATIAPNGAASVTLIFETFEMEPFDTLIIYDGPDINSPLIGKYNANNIVPGTITSSGGSITLRERTDGFIELPGYSGTYTCEGVAAPPIAGIGSEPVNSCNGQIQFSDLSENLPNQWEWDFGDGNTSDQPSPIHEYTEGGTYTVTLTVTNPYGSDMTTTSIDVVVLDPQVVIPTSANNGESVDFEGGNPMASYTWDFGDGSDPAAGVPSPSHTYDVTMTTTFTVTVTVTSPAIGADCMLTITQDIVVVATDVPPIAAINIGDQDCSGTVQFEDGSLPIPDTWSWDFGDGNTSEEQSPSHQYAETGTYTVTLTVSNEFGDNTTTTDVEVTVIDAALEIPSDIVTGEEVTFEGNNPTASYTWDFGDGSDPETGALVTHTYESDLDAVYTVSITVVTDDCEATFTQDVTFTSTSLSDLEVLNLVIAPNPTEGFVNIDMTLPTTQDLVIILTDITGRMIEQRRLETVQTYQERLDLSKQASGVYFLRFISGDQQLVRKITLQR